MQHYGAYISRESSKEEQGFVVQGLDSKPVAIAWATQLTTHRIKLKCLHTLATIQSRCRMAECWAKLNFHSKWRIDKSPSCHISNERTKQNALPNKKKLCFDAIKTIRANTKENETDGKASIWSNWHVSQFMVIACLAQGIFLNNRMLDIKFKL